MRVIFYVFAGRKANIEIALPYYQDILDRNPDAEIHLWDLCRDRADSKYLRTITGIDRLKVRTEFYTPGGVASPGQNRVWRYYAHPQFQNTMFVKGDDDVLFLESKTFDQFVESAASRPHEVTSALTINNGASTHLLPEVADMFEQLDIPLLDVHLSAEYAELSHRWFFDNWQTLINQPTNPTPAESWVSINLIAYNWHMGCKIAQAIGTRPPARIMDREYPARNEQGRILRHRVGDEGSVNMHPIRIDTGMVCGHATFGPQDRTMPTATLTEIRKHYADIARQYLCNSQSQVESNT